MDVRIPDVPGTTQTRLDAQFGADDPLLVDEQYAVKPAYYGVLDALWRR